MQRELSGEPTWIVHRSISEAEVQKGISPSSYAALSLPKGGIKSKIGVENPQFTLFNLFYNILYFFYIDNLHKL